MNLSAENESHRWEKQSQEKGIKNMTEAGDEKSDGEWLKFKLIF